MSDKKWYEKRFVLGGIDAALDTVFTIEYTYLVIVPTALGIARAASPCFALNGRAVLERPSRSE